MDHSMNRFYPFRSFLPVLHATGLCLFLGFCFATPHAAAQTYFFPGGSISQSDLNRARPYKKGTYLIQSGKNRGMIWIPKHDSRGNRWLELLMEHFLQGAEIRDYSPVQVGTIIGGSHGMASVLSLLMDPDARELLGIDKGQGEKINLEFTQFRAQVAARMKELQQTNQRATPLQTALARTSEIERLSLLLEPRLKIFLSDKQIQQAKELVFVLYGGFNTTVVDLDILSLFNLDKEQREKLELIAEDANQKRDRVFAANANRQPNAADYQASDAAMADVAFIISRKIQEVMNPEQIELAKTLMSNADKIKTKLRLTP